MNNISKSSLAIALSSTLMACGGSGSSDKKLSSPTTYYFTLKANVINKCGVSQPVADADFFLQDNQWGLISSHQTDENGQVKITTTTPTINYTVAKEQISNGSVQSVELRSYIDVKSASQATIIFESSQLADNSVCECNTQNLDLSYLLVDSVQKLASSTSFSASQVVDSSNARFLNVQACRELGKPWSKESFMVIASNSQNNIAAFSGFSDLFDATPGEDWPLNANAGAITLAIDHTKYERLTTGQLANNKLHFIHTSQPDDTQTIVFDNHSLSDVSTYYGKAENEHQETVSIVGTVLTKSTHTRFSGQYDDIVALSPSLKAPAIDTVIFSEVSPAGAYDYSKISDHDAIHFITQVNANKSTTNTNIPTSWHVYGPMTGTLPVADTLEKYSYIKRDITTLNKLTIEMFSSDNSSRYSDYIKAFNEGKTFHTSGPLSNYKTHFVYLEK